VTLELAGLIILSCDNIYCCLTISMTDSTRCNIAIDKHCADCLSSVIDYVHTIYMYVLISVMESDRNTASSRDIIFTYVILSVN